MKTGLKVTGLYVVLFLAYQGLVRTLIQTFKSTEVAQFLDKYETLGFMGLSAMLLFWVVSFYLRRVARSREELKLLLINHKQIFDRMPIPAFILDGKELAFIRKNNLARARYGDNLNPSILERLSNFDPRKFHRVLNDLRDGGYEEMGFDLLDHADNPVSLQAFCQRIQYNEEPAILMICFDVSEYKDVSVRVMDKMIDAMESDRISLASEIHDGIQQYFGLANGMLRSLMDRLAKEGRSGEMLERAEQLTSLGMEECRRLSHAISPLTGSMLDLHSNLIYLVENLNFLDKITFHLNVQLAGPYSEEITLNMYRIVQEATRNIRLHSRATNAWIRLEHKGNRLELEIEDDGCGFNVDLIAQTMKSLGMTTMRTRAYKLNGSFVLQSEPDRGTRILTVIPLEGTVLVA